MNLEDKINDCIPELVQFYIANDTNSTFEINLTNPNYSANATTRYQFDVTNSDFYSSLEGSIIINGINYVFNYAANGINSFVNALNNLGFGFFFTSTSGVNTYINVYDNTNTYNSLVIAITIYLEVNTISDLRLINGNNNVQTYVDVLGYYTYNGDGGGRFYWDATSTATDNGGSVIQPTGVAVGRWYRIFNGFVSVKYFGAVGDDVTNDLPFFDNAWVYCLLNKINLFVDSGIYNFNGGLLVNMIDFSIIGVKGQSILKTNISAGILYLFTVNNARIENISFVNNYSNTAEQYPAVVSAGNFSENVTNFVISNCYFTNPTVNTSAIALYVNGLTESRNVINNVKFDNNLFENIGREVMTIFNRSDVQSLMNDVKFVNNVSKNLGLMSDITFGEVGFVISFDARGQNIRVQNNFTENWKSIGFEIFEIKGGIFNANLFRNELNKNAAPFAYNQQNLMYNDIYLITNTNISTDAGKTYFYGMLYSNLVSNIFVSKTSQDTNCTLDIRSSAYNIYSNDILIGYDKAIFTAGESFKIPTTMNNNLINNCSFTTVQNVNLSNYGVVFWTSSINNYVINCMVFFTNLSIYANQPIYEDPLANDNIGVNNFYNDALIDYP